MAPIVSALQGSQPVGTTCMPHDGCPLKGNVQRKKFLLPSYTPAPRYVVPKRSPSSMASLSLPFFYFLRSGWRIFLIMKSHCTLLSMSFASRPDHPMPLRSSLPNVISSLAPSSCTFPCTSPLHLPLVPFHCAYTGSLIEQIIG